jgi:phage terminase small subunit
VNAKQKLFVAEYLKDLIATRAAIWSGYSKKTARSIGSENPTKPDIAAAIAVATDAALQKADVEVHEIIGRLKTIALATVKPYLERYPDGTFRVKITPELTDEQLAAIGEVTVDEVGGGTRDGKREAVRRVRFKMKDSLAALEMLGRYKKLFTDKHEFTADDVLIERLTAGRKRAAR